MQYINPYDLVISIFDDADEIGPHNILKYKKRIFAEIELSDDITINYGGHNLTKADCIKIFDHLENPQIRDFYYWVCIDRSLHEFLTSGDLDFFVNFRFVGHYKSDAFLEFISPFLQTSFDRELLDLYRKRDRCGLKTILTPNALVNQMSVDIMFKSTASYQDITVKEIKKLNDNIKNDKILAEEIDSCTLISKVKKLICPECLNFLPEYFSTYRRAIAEALRILSISNYNKYKDAETSLFLVKFALEIKSDDYTQSKLQEDLETIEGIHKKK